MNNQPYPLPYADAQFMQKPVFCFTSDIDWADEAAIEGLLHTFQQYSIPLTPFVTHKSEALESAYSTAEMRRHVGLHPNFLPGSTHGETPVDIIDHVQALWPSSTFYRCHSHYDNSQLSLEFHKRGFLFDSNTCLNMQAGLTPLRLATGQLRFPVFWEDDAYFLFDDAQWDFSKVKSAFDTPGIKVISVHPVHHARNTPNNAFHASCPDAPHPGKGTKTFLTELIEHVLHKGYAAMYMDELFASCGASP